MNRAVIFNKNYYDPFIDFIKAYAIICVLIGHTLPVTNIGYGLWAGMQVPLFILVQTFHFYKKENSKLNIKKLFQRIILPFMAVGIVEIGLIETATGGGQNLLNDVVTNGGGYGPGSYFPLIYIQIALLLPCFRWFFRRLSKKQLICVFFILAEGLEVVCSVVHPSEWFYRLLFIRYVCLIYLGWIWTQEGIKLSGKMIVLSVLSALAILYFEYAHSNSHINNEPWFYNTAWSFHRWPCYYYCANGLVFLLYVMWQWLKNSRLIENSVKVLAKSSYEIFLVQMCVCFFIGFWKIPVIAKIVTIWIFSIAGGVVLNRIVNLLFIKQKICIRK